MEPLQLKNHPVLSCMYCEGTWITRDQFVQLLREDRSKRRNVSLSNFEHSTDRRRFQCPSCINVELGSSYTENIKYKTCASCGGAFLPRGAENGMFGFSKSHDGESSKGLIWCFKIFVSIITFGVISG